MGNRREADGGVHQGGPHAVMCADHAHAQKAGIQPNLPSARLSSFNSQVALQNTWPTFAISPAAPEALDRHLHPQRLLDLLEDARQPLRPLLLSGLIADQVLADF